MRTYQGKIDTLQPNQIFVFGSNPQGRHGKGAALIARTKFGAKYGQARGMQGWSYGIVTKDLTKKTHPSVSTRDIKKEIAQLYTFALENPRFEFFIAYAGKGKLLSGYTPEQMASMFSQHPLPPNIIFEEEFAKLIQF